MIINLNKNKPIVLPLHQHGKQIKYIKNKIRFAKPNKKYFQDWIFSIPDIENSSDKLFPTPKINNAKRKLNISTIA